ncbi:MAG: cytochrome c biogenesis protein ResB [Phycisphaerae bacterium]|nr:cytochrome c biogenesis protein ResB [Phycisphaerae bacterium]
MAKLRRILMWAGLIGIVLLTSLSVFGAFLGGERAGEFFNSIPLTVYWFVFAVLLITAIVVFRNMIRHPDLVAIHLGCVIIIGGAMWGSRAGHQIQAELFGAKRVPNGFVTVWANETENRIFDADGNVLGQLDFRIKLEKFWIEYYTPTFHIAIDSGDDQAESNIKKLDYEIGKPLDVPFTDIRLCVLACGRFPPGLGAMLEIVRGGKSVGILLLAKGDSDYERLELKFVFDDERQWSQAGSPTLFMEKPQPRDYKSRLVIIKDGREISRKDIEVNDPLHYGGYHFYQMNYDPYHWQYTVLSVASDAGLSTVYLGLLLLCVGVVLRFWLRPIWRAVKKTS